MKNKAMIRNSLTFYRENQEDKETNISLPQHRTKETNKQIRPLLNADCTCRNPSWEAQQTSLEFSFRMFKNLYSSLGRRLTKTALSWKLGEWGFYTDWAKIFGKLLWPFGSELPFSKIWSSLPNVFVSLLLALENTYFLFVTVPAGMTRLEVTLSSLLP